MPDRPSPPAGLAKPGRDLWGRMHAALAEGLRFSVHETEVLTRCCQLADRELALRVALARDGLLTAGSRGQLALHPAVQELRAVEVQLCNLLERVSLADTAGRVQTPKHTRAVKAASARWGRERDELQARRKAAGLDG
jgi:phage terminase small subunit